MKIHFCRLLLATVLFSLMLTPASADDQATLFNFALELSHLKIDLNDGQQTVDTTTNYAGITSFQLREGKLQPGISLGYTYLSTDNQAVTAGMQLEGFYIRPAIRGVVIDNPHISLTLTGSYLFQRVEDSNANQSATLKWYQPQLDVEALWRFTQQMTLRAGGLYGRIDADESLSGDVNQTINLKKSSALGGYVGLEFDLGDDGQIGFLVHQGLGDGATLYFQRQF